MLIDDFLSIEMIPLEKKFILAEFIDFYDLLFVGKSKMSIYQNTTAYRFNDVLQEDYKSSSKLSHSKNELSFKGNKFC